MNTPSGKLRLLKMLLDTEDESILEEIRAVFEIHGKGKTYYEQDENLVRKVEESLAQLDAGEGIPHDQVMLSYSKWLKK